MLNGIGKCRSPLARIIPYNSHPFLDLPPPSLKVRRLELTSADIIMKGGSNMFHKGVV